MNYKPGILFLLTLVGLSGACGPSGTDPVLQQVSDQLVAVNQELVISLSASDEDGDELFYSYSAAVPDIYSRAALNRLPIGTSEFRWTPEARDVGVWFFDFVATDGSGSDTITIQIEVRAAVGGNSAPQFIHPQGSGTTLDLEVAQCLSLDVEISDSDSAQVRLGQGEPIIEGATLESLSGNTAIWEWCPSEEQISTDDRYTLLLTADDEENPVTLHPYLIVLQSPLKPNCPGDPPLIAHTASDVSSLTNLRINAVITDDVGLKQEPLLYYSLAMPSSPPDFSQMIQVIMVEESESNWVAQIPNPVVGQAMGSTADVYYVIVASDNDDAEGNCDHRSTAPLTGAFAMTVTNPGGEGGTGLCEGCIADVQCGSPTDLCVLVGSSSGAFCLQDCTANACPTDYECSVAPVQSVDGASARQCVPVSQDCSDPSGAICNDDSFENNDTRAEAEANAPLLANTTHDLVSCPALVGFADDEDFFRIVITEESLVEASLIGGSVSDIDLSMLDDSGTTLDSSVSLTSIENVSECVTAGTYFLRAFAFSPEENPYTLSYTATPQSCGGATCQDDSNEDDDNPQQARIPDFSLGPVTISNQAICANDQDWFAVDLIAGQLVSVDLTFAEIANGDLDIHFFTSASVDLTPCSPTDVTSCDTSNGQSGTANESAIFEAPSSGTFYIVIQGFDGDESSYDVVIETE